MAYGHPETARDIAERAHNGGPVALTTEREETHSGGPATPTDGLVAVLADRKKTHGKFTDHATFTQVFKSFQRQYQRRALSDTQREALEMIFHKIGRIMAGDPSVADHWLDIAGYARLVANELEAPKT